MEVPTSVAITKDNLFVQTHANIFNLINDRSNVPDPADSTGVRKFVYTREPNTMANNFAGYPFIIVPYPEFSQDAKVADATKAFQSDEFTITIYTQDKASDGSGNPSGARQAADITTNIVKTLNNKSNSQTLRNNGLRNKSFTKVDFDWGELDQKRIFKRELTLRFANQLRTIA